MALSRDIFEFRLGVWMALMWQSSKSGEEGDATLTEAVTGLYLAKLG